MIIDAESCRCKGLGHYFILPYPKNPFLMSINNLAEAMIRITCDKHNGNPNSGDAD